MTEASGHAVDDTRSAPAAALSIAMPTARCHRRMLPELAAALTAATHAIERDHHASADDDGVPRTRR